MYQIIMLHINFNNVMYHLCLNQAGERERSNIGSIIPNLIDCVIKTVLGTLTINVLLLLLSLGNRSEK